jgi:hypothetical protein
VRILAAFQSAASGLAEHPQDHGGRDLYRVFSHGLDSSAPNLTATVADIDRNQPLTELVKILESANSTSEFRNLCEYIYKITSKNFGQVQRHARDVIALLDTSEYDRFLDRMGQLMSATEAIHVVMSFDYEQHFNSIARGAETRGIDIESLECSRLSHFELIGPNFPKDRLEGVLSTVADS